METQVFGTTSDVARGGRDHGLRISCIICTYNRVELLRRV
jgi:hypothetical protein